MKQLTPEPDLNASQLASVRELMLRTRFASRTEEALQTEAVRDDLDQHVWTRYVRVKRFVVPWLARVAPDLGRRAVVEVGCGTGSSGVALRPAVGSLTGLDIDASAVDIATERARILGVPDVRFRCVEPAEVASALRGFDRVEVLLLFAVLEHMTLAERHEVLRAAQEILPSGGLLVVGETPNRLAWLDRHTSHLPFFQMLPPEVQAHYFDRSPRTRFVEAVRDAGDRDLTLARWGRGLSYHDFEIAFGAPLAPGLVVADGYEPEILGMYPERLDDRALQQAFEEFGVQQSRAFTRSTLNFVVRVP